MGSRELRPAQIGSARMGSYSDWAAMELRPDPIGQADPDLCRQSYLMWCSDRILMPEPLSKQRGAILAFGGRWVGTGENLVYLGVVLAPVPGTRVPPAVTGAALVALRDAGVITGEQALKAAMDLA
jgi:hypothetical protein